MKLYGGIDLHSNNNVIGLLDKEDRVVYRRRLPNDLHLVLLELEPFRSDIFGLVVESTYNWYWRVDGLVEAGYQVHLANTAAIARYSGLKHADDDTDACWLAKLLRLRLLTDIFLGLMRARGRVFPPSGVVPTALIQKGDWCGLVLIPSPSE